MHWCASGWRPRAGRDQVFMLGETSTRPEDPGRWGESRSLRRRRVMLSNKLRLRKHTLRNNMRIDLEFIRVKPLVQWELIRQVLYILCSPEKIYLQGKLAGQRRADEASSAQYLRWFWQGFFVKMLTSTQNCAEIWSWPMPSSRNPMTQWLLIPNYSNQFIFWWNLWKRFLNRIFLP